MKEEEEEKRELFEGERHEMGRGRKGEFEEEKFRCTYSRGDSHGHL